MRYAPAEIRHEIKDDMRVIVDCHQWMTFDEAELVLLHMVDKHWPMDRYNCRDTLNDISFRIMQRETENEMKERLKIAEAWFSIYGWPL